MKAGISLPRGQLRVDRNLNLRLRSTQGLLHAFHSIKEFSFWNRQMIKSKTATTAVSLQGINENWAYTKRRANGAPTEEEFQHFNVLTGQVYSMGRAGSEAEEDVLSSPGLTSRSWLSAQTCTCGQSVIASRDAITSLLNVNWRPSSWGVQGNFILKRSICLHSCIEN